MLRSILLAGLLLSNVQAYSQDLIADPNLIKSIYFGGGSYYIDSYQRLELKQFINSFDNIDNYKITVHSYTDDIGTDEYNQMLSEMRGGMTIRELVENGVIREQIEIHDFGEFNPVYDNSTMRPIRFAGSSPPSSSCSQGSGCGPSRGGPDPISFRCLAMRF